MQHDEVVWCGDRCVQPQRNTSASQHDAVPPAQGMALGGLCVPAEQLASWQEQQECKRAELEGIVFWICASCLATACRSRSHRFRGGCGLLLSVSYRGHSMPSYATHLCIQAVISGAALVVRAGLVHPLPCVTV